MEGCKTMRLFERVGSSNLRFGRSRLAITSKPKLCLRVRMARVIPLVMGVVATSPMVLAESNGDARDTELEEITIVASRLNADVIGVESIDLIETYPSFSLAQVLRKLTSTSISQSGNLGSLTQLRVRGAEADHVKVLLNGNPVNLASANLNLSTISPIAISRIDSLNGPRSAIWGHDALAGVINLSTTPINSVNRVYADSGSNQAWSVGTDLGTELGGIPFSFHLAKRITEGTNASYEGDERDGFSQDAMHVGYQKSGTIYQANGFLRSTMSSSDYDPIPRDGDRHVDVNDQMVAQQFSWQPNDELRLSANASLNRSKLRNFSEGKETNSSRGDSARLAFEGSFSLAPSQDLSFVVDHTTEDFEQRGTPSFFGDPNYDESLATTGLASEYLISIRRIQWHSSLRREQNDQFGNSTAWQTSVMLRQDSLRWSYSVGVGIKNPTFIERFGFTPDQFLGNPELEPERALQHQAALQYTRHDQSLEVALYSSTLDDEINGFAYNADANQFTAANLSTESRRRGGEIRYVRTFQNVSIESNYAYVKSEENRTSEIRRPKHLANLNVHYAHSDRIRTHGALHYVGEQFDRDFSTFPATLVTLDGHVIASASVEYDLTSGLTLIGMVDNVFDTEYERVFGFRTPGRTLNFGARAEF